MMAVSPVALVGNAKRTIELEVNAGRALAHDNVIAAVGLLMRSNKPEEAVAFLPGTLFQPRHVRIAVIDDPPVTHLGRRNLLAEFSPREVQILRPIGRGVTYENIAAEIHVSHKTVANVSSGLRRTLSARSLSDPIRIALEVEASSSIDQERPDAILTTAASAARQS